MEIKGSHIQSQLNVYQSAQMLEKNTDSIKSKKPEAPMSQQDRVALSGRGRSIADAQRAMASVPDVRESLIFQIRNDLQNSTYAVDIQQAAEGLLRESMVNQAALM